MALRASACAATSATWQAAGGAAAVGSDDPRSAVVAKEPSTLRVAATRVSDARRRPR
jgi:hypothetical protein